MLDFGWQRRSDASTTRRYLSRFEFRAFFEICLWREAIPEWRAGYWVSVRRPFLAPGFPATQQERTAPAVLLAASLHAAPDLTQEAETTGARAPARPPTPTTATTALSPSPDTAQAKRVAKNGGTVDCMAVIKRGPRITGIAASHENGYTGPIKRVPWGWENTVSEWFYEDKTIYDSKSMIFQMIEAVSRD
jgi:hypothetical protein